MIMSKSKLIECKSCGREISSKGKVTCPNCGRVNKKPIYKRIWFIALMVIILFSIISNFGSEDNTSTSFTGNVTTTSPSNPTNPVKQPEKEAIIVTVDELYAALKDNALKASNDYKNLYVEVTGKLSNIDASGSYFALKPLNKDFTFDSLLCNISVKHINSVIDLSIGQEVTVIGTISSVGEIMGFALKVDRIVGYDSDSTSSNNIGPTDELLTITVDELFEVLNDNPLKASKMYKGQRVQLSGRLSVIDASGSYFSLAPLYQDYTFNSVHCNITKVHLEKVMEFNSDQEVVLTGKIKDVGEVLGFFLDVEEIH